MIVSVLSLHAALRVLEILYAGDVDPRSGAPRWVAPWSLALRCPEAAVITVLIVFAVVAVVILVGGRTAVRPAELHRALRRTLWCAAVFYVLYAAVLLELLHTSADWPIGTPAQNARRLLLLSAAALWIGIALLLGIPWRRYAVALSRHRAAAP